MRKEQEIVFQNENREQLLEGKIDRREFMSKTLTAGLGLAGVGVAANFGSNSAQAGSHGRPLTPTFYQWIEDLWLRPRSVKVPGMFMWVKRPLLK